jgi:hypothetical protein
MKPIIAFDEDKLPANRKFNGLVLLIVVLSVIVRGFFAWTLELGNDEVYYWTYALYPALSHFDHPPMVGFVIQAFTFDLYFDSEFFIRLGAVILGGANTWLIYLIGKVVKDKLTGLFAAMLYNASVYCFVIAGIFILPDTPQLFFWLLSLYMIIVALPDKETTKASRNIIFYVGIPLGLAMLSKYTSVFLWMGVGLYIIFFNRKWLKTAELYISVLISLVIFSPVILWNIENNFISFSFQSARVGIFGSGLRPDYFATEFFGQVFYNNPFNFVLIIMALVALKTKKFSLPDDYTRILLLTSLPLIFVFLFFALFNRTLPHWTGPAYLSLIIIAAAWLSEKAMKPEKAILFPFYIRISMGFLLVGLTIGLFQIKRGIFQTPKTDNPKELGKNDLTLDMYGWRQFAYKFHEFADHDFFSKRMAVTAPIISHRWFPAAHLDYYVARPRGMDLLAIGDLERIHKYAWINRERHELLLDSDAYYITSSRDFQDPAKLFGKYFVFIEKPEIIKIFKRDQHVENFFVYRLRSCLEVPPDVLEQFGIMKPYIDNFIEEPEESDTSAPFKEDSLRRLIY